VSRNAGATLAERELVRLCHSGLEVTELRHRVLRSLRRLMPVDAAFVATADPQTLLFTGAHAEEPLGAATPLFLDNEFGADDVNKFAALATSDTHVASLDAVTHDDRPASMRYRDILRPLGLGDELRAALVTGSECWGYLCLHRGDHPLGFTDSEAGLIARLGPHLAHALRQSVLVHGSAATAIPQAPGVVLLTDDLSIVAITEEAELLLALIANYRSGSQELPVVVYAVAAALKVVEQGTAGPAVMPSIRVPTTGGSWLRVHASRLRGPPGEQRISIVIEQIDARATVPLLLSAHGLTARESQVATLVLRGAPTTAIADALHISRHTVQDHLKAVFDKVGVHTRRDLVGELLGTARQAPP